MQPQVVDGRTVRREKSRQRIIDAIVQIVTEGEVEPTAVKVAQIAGVTMRTVFRHFDDMESLLREVVLDLRTQTDALRVDFNPGEDWRAQFEQLIVRRSGLFEKFMPRLLWATAARHKSPVINEDLQNYSKRLRQSLATTLPDQFVANSEAFSAVEAVLSWGFWIRLRRDQKLPVKGSTKVVQTEVTAILKDAGY